MSGARGAGPRRDPAFARRRRAAVPGALAALVALAVVTGSHAPTTLAGGIAPGMTVVVPAPSPPLASAAPPEPPPEPPAPLPEETAIAPAGGGEPATTAAPVDASPPDSAGGTAGQGKRPAPERERDPAEEPPPSRPSVRHVFLVVLADTDLVALADDATAAPYFAGTLAPQGTLLTHYAAIARGALPNAIALISGQGPTAQTLADCPTYGDITPDRLGPDGQQLGDGCVYPFASGTIADQLQGIGKPWRAYGEDVGAAAATGAATTCRHPAPGAADDTRDPRPGDAYATRRNPFAYFHSLLDTDQCARNVVGLDRLDADLALGARAPAFAYVVPNLCHDGRATPCAPEAPAGAAAADAFLAGIVPRILASPAYADDGLLILTSDQAPPPATSATTATPAATLCCGPTAYPNVGDAAAVGAGERVGALLVSPLIAAGATDPTPANHFTLLRTLSDLFELQPLGYAGSSDVTPLPARVLPTTTASVSAALPRPAS